VAVGKMVTRAAWVPTLGTYLVGETSEPFNPNLGGISHTTLSPAELEVQADDKNTQPLEIDAARLLSDTPQLEALLTTASLCNLATVMLTKDGWTARGDPTECAIQVFVHRFGLGRDGLVRGPDAKWSKT
jgi:Na+-exporting ATPase